jgi:hypothetical protein
VAVDILTASKSVKQAGDGWFGDFDVCYGLKLAG